MTCYERVDDVRGMQGAYSGNRVVDMKVLFVLPNISVGGVERVRLALIEYFSARGIECRLALSQRRGELLEHACQLVAVDDLAPRGLHQFVPSLARLIRRVRPTHVVTAFADIGVLTWLALRLARSRAKWVHTVDGKDIAGPDAGSMGKLQFLTRRHAARFVYRYADAVVPVSEGLRAEVISGGVRNPRRVTVLYNPVVPNEELQWRRKPPGGDPGLCRIVAMGRLAPEKGFDSLLRALVKVQGPWQLSIWGEGAERVKLTRLIMELDMQDRVRLCGYTSDPLRALRDSDLFVMPSQHEGLGNALIEALACQCQIVASDCPYGPREILQDGRLGELVPVGDVDALAGAIERAMAGQRRVSPELLLQRANDFSVSKTGSQWEQLLRELSVG